MPLPTLPYSASGARRELHSASRRVQSIEKLLNSATLAGGREPRSTWRKLRSMDNLPNSAASEVGVGSLSPLLIDETVAETGNANVGDENEFDFAPAKEREREREPEVKNEEGSGRTTHHGLPTKMRVSLYVH